MKTFKQFVHESSLSRVVSKSKKGGTAILSGSRADKSAKENKARAKQLDKDIRGKGYGGATKATGRYTERDKETGKETKVKERSHIVSSGKKSKKDFKKDMKKLAKKYDQDSVLVQKKKGTAGLKATRKGGLGKDKSVALGKMRPGRPDKEGDTAVKKKPFSYSK
jgi:hypothetical protein